MSHPVKTIFSIDPNAAQYWEALPNVRWYTDLPQKPPVLQQAWKSERGQVEWRDVPLEMG